MTEIDILQHKWQIIFNNSANEKRNIRNLEAVAAVLEKYHIDYSFHIVSKPGEGIAKAEELCSIGCRHLVAAGGDGTVNEVVNGIFRSGVCTTDLFLAVLPLGRGNDWVRTHNYPNELEDVVKLWLSGTFIKHDIGLVTTFKDGKASSRRYFANIAGFGFDADVIHDVTFSPPHLFGMSVYLLSLLKTLIHHKPTSVQISDGKGFTFTGKVFMVIAAICRYNGGGICEAKYAKPDDGLVDLIVVPKMRFFKVIWHLKDMFKGDHIDKIRGIRQLRTGDVRISSPVTLRGEVEGELLETGDYRIEVLPNTLNMLSDYKN